MRMSGSAFLFAAASTPIACACEGAERAAVSLVLG